MRNLLPAVVPIIASLAALVCINQMEVLAGINPLVRALLISLPPTVMYVALLALFYRSRLSALRRD